ncbi:carboxypeptidase O-like [Discoglossus pictus]
MKTLYWSICVFGILVLEDSCQKVTYNGDQVLKIIPETSEQAYYLQELSNKWMLDLWKPDMVEEIHPGYEMHVRVPFSHVHQMKNILFQLQMKYKVLINDVQELIDKTTVKETMMQRRSLEEYDYTKYHSMNEIYHWMDQIKDKYSGLVKQHYLGSTYEQRPIYYFKIGWPSNNTKKIVFMDCGIHAREWISVSFCQWFVREILANQNKTLLSSILKKLDFFVVPVLNVDGYVYTWTTERLWRKNRMPFADGFCYGVDLNRNFDSHWCSIGASKDCDSLTYCGPSPASELETKAVSALIQSAKANIVSYLTFHSYGQLILIPYGYTTINSPNHDELMVVAKKAATKMKEKHNITYRVGASSVILYDNSGSSSDWAADIGIRFSYTYELRDEGTYGFQLPPEQIKPTCEEIMTGVMSMVEYLNEKYFNNSAMAITS